MREIVIDVRESDIKVALVNDGIIDEVWLERDANQKIVGNVYKGKVVNVLQGMQACFVDIGRERNAFLYAGDVVVDGKALSYQDEVPDKFPLRPGDIIMCQVLKEEFGNKGARLTMNLSLPGRTLVMSPNVDYVCVSRKIENEERKTTLEEFVRDNRVDDYGYIIRTEADNATVEDILRDMKELSETYLSIKENYLKAPIASCIYTDCDVVSRAIRDMLKTDVERIIVNDKSTVDKIRRDYSFIAEKRPDLLHYYQGTESLYHKYGLTTQLEALVKRRVDLSNGAYLIIDRTEALTVIDVNTGKYVGDINLEETVFVTNTIAAREIARQLRLRNLSGIIIVDFIDMANEEHRESVLDELKKALKNDRMKATVIGMTELGLVQITRKKTRNALVNEFTSPCPYCGGEGVVFNEEFTIMRARDYLIEMFQVNPTLTGIKLFVHPQVANKLITSNYMSKECADEWADKRVYVIPDPRMHIEKYNVEKITDKIIDLPDNAKLLA